MPRISWVGQTIGGRYKIEKLLGQGGMSAVYQAVDPNLQRVVAIKLIHPHLSVDPSFIDRFKKEAAVVASLRHPNIVQVHDFNNDGETYYMVMEFLAGETLQNRLKRLNSAGRTMEFREAMKIAIQIADAADYAHNHNLIHRDIKPANVMLDVNNQAILMDFGIVKIVGGEYHTATGATVGTAMYMSPEQIRSERVDERSDIYSLGVMLYEMLSGRTPYKADSAMTLMMMVLNDPLPNLKELRKDVPDQLVAVVEKALAKDKKDRFQTAAEMVNALRVIQGQLNVFEPEVTVVEENASEPTVSKLSIHSEAIPIEVQRSEREKASLEGTTLVDEQGTQQAKKISQPLSKRNETPSWFASRRFLFLSLGGLLLIAVVISVILIINARKLPVLLFETIPTPPARLTSETVTSMVSLGDWQTQSEIEEIAFSPEGNLLGVANNHYRHGLSPGRYYGSLINLREANLHSYVHDQTQKVTGVDFSPDGQLFASTSDDGTVAIWNVSDGNLVRKIDAGMGSLTNVDFSPNNQLMATSSWDGMVGLWQLNTGQLLRTLKISDRCLRDVEFSPDGKLLAAASDDQTIFLWQVSNGSLQQTFSGHTAIIYHLAFSPDGTRLASASEDKTVRIWQVSNAHQSVRLQGHAEPVYDVAFSPDNSLVASSSGDGKIIIWKVQDGSVLNTVSNQGDSIYSLVFSPDGLFLVSGATNGVIQFWGLSEAIPIDSQP